MLVPLSDANVKKCNILSNETLIFNWFEYITISKTDTCVKKSGGYMEIKRDKYLNDLIIRKNNGLKEIL